MLQFEQTCDAVYFLQESEQNQPAASQGSMTERTGSLSPSNQAPPGGPFGGHQLQAAAERTAVTDARFSSLQRLSGTASTSDTGTQQVSWSFIHTYILQSVFHSFMHPATGPSLWISYVQCSVAPCMSSCFARQDRLLAHACMLCLAIFCRYMQQL